MPSYADTMNQFSQAEVPDPNTFLQTIWPHLTQEQQGLFSALMTQPNNRRDVVQNASEGTGVSGTTNNAVKKTVTPAKTTYRKDTIHDINENTDHTALQTRVDQEVAGATVPKDTYKVSADPSVGNVVGGPNGQPIYLKGGQTVNQTQEMITNRMAENGLSPDGSPADKTLAAGVTQAAQESGVAKGTRIKLRTGAWIDV